MHMQKAPWMSTNAIRWVWLFRTSNLLMRVMSGYARHVWACLRPIVSAWVQVYSLYVSHGALSPFTRSVAVPGSLQALKARPKTLTNACNGPLVTAPVSKNSARVVRLVANNGVPNGVACGAGNPRGSSNALEGC